MIDDITFLNIFSRENHCRRSLFKCNIPGPLTGNFVETLICNQKPDLKPVLDQFKTMD